MVLYLWNCSPNKGRHSHHLPVRPAHQRQTGAHEAVTFAGCSAGAHPTSCWVPEPLPGGGAPPGSITDSDTRPGRQVTSAQPRPAMPRTQGPALGYCRGQAAVQSSWGRACAHVCACGPGEGPVTVLTWGPTARRGHLLRPGGAGTSRTQHLPGTCSLLARRPRSPSGTIPLPPGPGGSASPSCPGTGAGKCLISLILSGGLSPPPAARTAPHRHPHRQGRTTCRELAAPWPGVPSVGGQTAGCPELGQSRTIQAGGWSSCSVTPGPLHTSPLLLSTSPSLLFGSLYSPPPGRPPSGSGALLAIPVSPLQCKGVLFELRFVSAPPPQGPRAWCRARHTAGPGGQALERPMTSAQSWSQESTAALSSQRPTQKRPGDSGSQRGTEINSRTPGIQGRPEWGWGGVG